MIYCEKRAQAIRDAEAFEGLLFSFEKLGSFLKGEIKSLGAYIERIVNLAKESSLAEDVPEQHGDFHSSVAILFDLVRDARNDALHQGAFARHLTSHAIELSIILEDALTSMATKIGDFMVRNPVCAEMWQPLSFIRQQMLTNSFSHLPVKKNRNWELVSDTDIARFLRNQNNDRNKRLALTLEEACAIDSTLTSNAEMVSADEEIKDVLGKLNGRPLLVHRQNEKSELIGIITAFDLL